VAELGSLASQREALAVDIPVELLRYIDEGGNPDVFTAEVFEQANKANQEAKGKVEAFAAFR
jgi:mediator of RNA polymerase II transcription subunit 10